MKLSHFLFIVVLGIGLGTMACNSKKDDTNSQEGIVSPEGMNSQGPGGTPVSLGGEPHYKCPTAGCAGGAESQGPCPICGATLEHNQAYHSQNMGAPEGASPENPIQINPSSSTPTPMPEPPAAQNAKGVYHYTCPKGCAGGAGAAGNCGTCGGALVHNQEFHN